MLQCTGVGLRGIMFTGMGVDDVTVYGCGGLRGIMFTGMGVDDATGYGCGPAGNNVHRYGSR